MNVRIPLVMSLVAFAALTPARGGADEPEAGAVGRGGAAVGRTGGGSACDPDADIGDLLKAAGDAARKLPDGAMDRLMLEDLVANIESYQRGRAHLCSAVDGALLEVEKAHQQRDGWRDLYLTEKGRSELYREGMEQAQRKAAQVSTGHHFFSCVAGGGPVYEPGGIIAVRPAAVCGWQLWP